MSEYSQAYLDAKTESTLCFEAGEIKRRAIESRRTMQGLYDLVPSANLLASLGEAIQAEFMAKMAYFRQWNAYIAAEKTLIELEGMKQ